MTYYAIKLFSAIISLLPRCLAIFCAKRIGWLIYHIYPKRSHVAKINLSIAFPQKSIKEIEELIKKTYQHYMVVTIDFLSQKYFNHKNIFIDEKTKNILSNNNGMIFMTAHIGAIHVQRISVAKALPIY